MVLAGDCCIISAAGQLGARSGRQRGAGLENHIVIGHQISGRLDRLGVNTLAVQVGAHIPCAGVIDIGGDDNREVIATHTGVLGIRISAACLFAVAQPPAVDGGGVLENLTQGQQLGVVIPVAKDGLAVLLELARIAFVNADDVINAKDATLKEDASRDDLAAIQSVKVKSFGEDGVEREIKLADKLKALDMLGRHLAMWNDKLQLSGMEEEKSKLDSLIKQISGGG